MKQKSKEKPTVVDGNRSQLEEKASDALMDYIVTGSEKEKKDAMELDRRLSKRGSLKPVK